MTRPGKVKYWRVSYISEREYEAVCRHCRYFETSDNCCYAMSNALGPVLIEDPDMKLDHCYYVDDIRKDDE